MHGGHYAAHNIHQTILRDRVTGYQASFKEFTEFPPVIGLAVGKKAVAYSPDSGTISGEDVMQAYFRGDLGFESKFLYFFAFDLFLQANILGSQFATITCSLVERRTRLSPLWLRSRKHRVTYT